MATILQEPQTKTEYEQALDDLGSISPEWAYRIKRYGRQAYDRFRDQISSSAACIVGEAHGGLGVYGCQTCHRFAGSYGQGVFHSEPHARGSGLLCPERWEAAIPAFVNHWKTEHATTRVRLYCSPPRAYEAVPEGTEPTITTTPYTVINCQFQFAQENTEGTTLTNPTWQTAVATNTAAINITDSATDSIISGLRFIYDQHAGWTAEQNGYPMTVAYAPVDEMPEAELKAWVEEMNKDPSIIAEQLAAQEMLFKHTGVDPLYAKQYLGIGADMDGIKGIAAMRNLAKKLKKLDIPDELKQTIHGHIIDRITNIKRKVGALEKSRRLLRKMLSKAEYTALMEKGEVILPSQKDPEITYIIKKNAYEKVIKCKQGKPEESLCVIPSNKDMPAFDNLLSKILLLKTDEDRFYKLAGRARCYQTENNQGGTVVYQMGRAEPFAYI